jgi:hypothetical protein
MKALRALEFVSAQRCGPAQGQFSQHLLHLRRGLTTVISEIDRCVLPQQVDYAEGWGASFRGGVFGTSGGARFEASFAGGSEFDSSQRGHWRTGSQSSGLGIDSK